MVCEYLYNVFVNSEKVGHFHYNPRMIKWVPAKRRWWEGNCRPGGK